MQENSFADDQNPYAVSESGLGAAEGRSSGIRIDGDLVVVGKPASLPNICVISGETEDLIPYSRTLTYVSPVVIVVFFLSRLIGLIMYLMMRKQTPTTFFLARSVRSSMRWKIFYGLLCLAGAMAVLIGILSASQQVAPWLIAIPIILFIVGLIFVVKGTNVLSVKKFAAPDEFGIRGCKAPFFATLEQHPELATTSGY